MNPSNVDYCMEQVAELTLQNYYSDVNANSVNLFLHQIGLKTSSKITNRAIDQLLDIFTQFPQLEVSAVEVFQTHVSKYDIKNEIKVGRNWDFD